MNSKRNKKEEMEEEEDEGFWFQASLQECQVIN